MYFKIRSYVLKQKLYKFFLMFLFQQGKPESAFDAKKSNSLQRTIGIFDWSEHYQKVCLLEVKYYLFETQAEALKGRHTCKKVKIL